MLVRARYLRLGWLVAAVCQLLLPAVSVADARAEAESLRSAPAAHVEATGAKGCPRVHPADCAVCRLLAAATKTESPTNLQVPVARFIDATAQDSNRPACLTRFPGDPPQRAPPV